MPEKDFNFMKLAEEWPAPIVWRGELFKFTGGLINPRTQANIDSRGEGPEERYKHGRKTFYATRPYCRWLQERYAKATRGAA